MKKIALLLTIILVFTLTGCSEKPFVSDVDGFTFTETDKIVYSVDSGVVKTDVFELSFSKNFKMFINEDQSIINFKNINNYLEVSDEIKRILDEYGQRVSLRKIATTNYRTKQELSLGADESNYNYEKITVDELAYDVSAFIAVDNGVTMFISFTEFTVGDESLYIPSFIQLFVNEIHREISWEYVGENNDYTNLPGKIIRYEKIIVPLPMKTGADSPFAELTANDGLMIDDYTRFIDEVGTVGTWELCGVGETENCIEENYTELNVQIYEMNIQQVYDFYEQYYSGSYDNGSYVFVNRGYTFTIDEMEEVEVRQSDDSIVNVVNAVIRIFE